MTVEPDTPQNERPLKLMWHERNKKLLVLKRQIARAFAAAGDVTTASKLNRCGEYEQLVCCGACGGYWWTRYRCKLRCCPVCSRDKARDRTTYLLAVASKQAHCKMITLTMRRWTGDPREGIKVLRDATQRFRDSKLMRSCKGGAYTIEVIPKPDGWHIHCHMIIDSGYIPFRSLIRVWAACLKQPNPHVRIQNASQEATKRYICKYASKSMVEEVGPTRIVEWYKAVVGSRLWATFGAWYNVTLEDLTDGAESTKISMPCPFCGRLHTVFAARAGPAIMGRDWRAFAHGELAKGDWERPQHDIVAYIDKEDKF